MNIFGIPRQVELWRQTTPEVSGWDCAPVVWGKAAKAGGGEVLVCLAETPYPHINNWLRFVGRRPTLWASQPRGSVEPDRTQGVRVALCEDDPVRRVRLVWDNCISNPAFRALDPMRFAGAWFLSWPDFVRWLMHQDPLGVDQLLRPHWSMMPQETMRYPLTDSGLAMLSARLHLDLPPPPALEACDVSVSLVAAGIIRTLYAADVSLVQ